MNRSLPTPWPKVIRLRGGTNPADRLEMRRHSDNRVSISITMQTVPGVSAATVTIPCENVAVLAAFLGRVPITS